MMRIVITGGAGFIGSNLAEVLALAPNNEVCVVDDLSTGRVENLPIASGIEFIKGSITDLQLMNEVLADADFVFHQAALPGVQRSIEDPAHANEVNIRGTLNVLMAARDAGVKKVIYASSSSVYGDTPELPKREGMTPNPLSPYAVTKLVGEYYCKVFNDVYGLNTISLRYFNVYGPRQDPHSEYAAVIPRFVSRVLRGEPPIIYGDGQQTRDFTFVKDVVNANILAMNSDATGVYNIASGRMISIQELATLITRLTGRDSDLEPVFDKPRKGDVRHSLADISRARAVMGYKPEYSLERGLEETLRWFKFKFEFEMVI
ncbi:MAG: SDR family oxidoreductase [Methanophagales archaeon]|nr:SDR family oxidoreductase [Methanophagales archaeon]MCW3138908.1 SDR family oxidoreductase [Methanophagales archaeon]MCW3139915.1 SDR family oxidoreductase [Methanophagales archaeon]